MGAVRLVFRAELRRRWPSWLAISLLVALVGGFVLAVTAAGRRTESAFPRFVAKYGFDAVGYATRPVPRLATLPEVASATRLVSPLSGQPTCACHGVIDSTNFSVTVLPANPESFSKLVSGHWPDESSTDQVLASFTLQQDFGVHLGTVIHVPFYAASQLQAYFSATGAEPTPTGPALALRVVGFEASEGDFPAGAASSYSLYATHAFARTVVPHTGVAEVYLVRLHRGAAGLARFGVDVNALASAGVAGYESGDQLNVSVQASIHPQAVGWWLLAVLAGLVGLLVIGQALARQTVVESEDHPTLATLGLDRSQLVALSMVRNLAPLVRPADGLWNWNPFYCREAPQRAGEEPAPPGTPRAQAAGRVEKDEKERPWPVPALRT